MDASHRARPGFNSSLQYLRESRGTAVPVAGVVGKFCLFIHGTIVLVQNAVVKSLGLEEINSFLPINRSVLQNTNYLPSFYGNAHNMMHSIRPAAFSRRLTVSVFHGEPHRKPKKERAAKKAADKLKPPPKPIPELSIRNWGGSPAPNEVRAEYERRKMALLREFPHDPFLPVMIAAAGLDLVEQALAEVQTDYERRRSAVLREFPFDPFLPVAIDIAGLDYVEQEIFARERARRKAAAAELYEV